MRRWLLMIVFWTPLLAARVAPAQQGAAIHYVYDELGRLIAVVDQQGNSATYAYDAVGNLLAIERFNATDQPGPVAITLVKPNRGQVGTEVEMFGKGFSATASQNAVTFNGSSATVAEASPNRIKTSVPAGATTGSIQVTSPLGTGVSPTPFTVGATMTISPAQAAVLAGTSLQLQALEAGSPLSGVIWAVNGIPGGDVTIGTITSGGVYTAPAKVPGGVYTAPPALSAALAAVTITATREDDKRASGSAALTVVGKAPFGAAVSIRVTEPAAGSVVSQNVGASVSATLAESTFFVSTKPLAITISPVVTGVSPAVAAAGTTMTITFTGVGFSEATGVTFLLPSGPDSALSATNLQISPSGMQLSCDVTVTSGAALGGRVVQVTTPGGVSTTLGTGSNVLTVQ